MNIAINAICNNYKFNNINSFKGNSDKPDLSSEVKQSSSEMVFENKNWEVLKLQLQKSKNQAGKHGLKCSKDMESKLFTKWQKTLITNVTKELESNKNVDLLSYSLGWGSYIHPSSNPQLYLYIDSDDYNKMTDMYEEVARSRGGKGYFQLSVLGTNRKVDIVIPNEDLTDDMKYIDISIQSGIHPFLVDMTKYLDNHPEQIEEIEKCVGKIDLSTVDSDTIQIIRDCE